MGQLMDTPLVKAPLNVGRRQTTSDLSIPGCPNKPGYEVMKVMSDVAFERNLAQLWADHQRERAFKKAHP